MTLSTWRLVRPAANDNSRCHPPSPTCTAMPMAPEPGNWERAVALVQAWQRLKAHFDDGRCVSKMPRPWRSATSRWGITPARGSASMSVHPEQLEPNSAPGRACFTSHGPHPGDCDCRSSPVDVCFIAVQPTSAQ